MGRVLDYHQHSGASLREHGASALGTSSPTLSRLRNCTMVCPTCFCTTVEDTTNLAGDQAARTRRWDSCFSLDFLTSMAVRALFDKGTLSTLDYPQFAAWIDQFGSSGCVGCGRCITWCPVGIDVTEEIRSLRDQ